MPETANCNRFATGNKNNDICGYNYAVKNMNTANKTTNAIKSIIRVADVAVRSTSAT